MLCCVHITSCIAIVGQIKVSFHFFFFHSLILDSNLSSKFTLISFPACVSQTASVSIYPSDSSLRWSSKTPGSMWVYFHAILVGEAWPGFQSLLPDGGSNMQGKGEGKKRENKFDSIMPRPDEKT